MILRILKIDCCATEFVLSKTKRRKFSQKNPIVIGFFCDGETRYIAFLPFNFCGTRDKSRLYGIIPIRLLQVVCSKYHKPHD